MKGGFKSALKGRELEGRRGRGGGGGGEKHEGYAFLQAPLEGGFKGALKGRGLKGGGEEHEGEALKGRVFPLPPIRHSSNDRCPSVRRNELLRPSSLLNRSPLFYF